MKTTLTEDRLGEIAFAMLVYEFCDEGVKLGTGSIANYADRLSRGLKIEKKDALAFIKGELMPKIFEETSGITAASHPNKLPIETRNKIALGAYKLRKVDNGMHIQPRDMPTFITKTSIAIRVHHDELVQFGLLILAHVLSCSIPGWKSCVINYET